VSGDLITAPQAYPSDCKTRVLEQEAVQLPLLLQVAMPGSAIQRTSPEAMQSFQSSPEGEQGGLQSLSSVQTGFVQTFPQQISPAAVSQSLAELQPAHSLPKEPEYISSSSPCLQHLEAPGKISVPFVILQALSQTVHGLFLSTLRVMLHVEAACLHDA